MEEKQKQGESPSKEKEEWIPVPLEEKQKDEIVKFDDFNNVNEQLQYADYLINSGMVQFAKPEHMVMAMNTGRALGVDATVAATYLYAIEGKITLSVHLGSALARKAGLDWTILKDGEYEYMNLETSEIIYTKTALPTDDETKKKYKYLNIVTEIKFFRRNEKLDTIIENIFRYTINDAQTARIIKEGGSWTKRPRNMLRARCLMDGIRFCASDAILGIFYEASEIIDSSNSKIDYELDDNGDISMDIPK